MYDALKLLPEYTPDYVVSEVEYYFDKISQGKYDYYTLDNAISLVNLAEFNNRVTEEQAETIKKAIMKIKEMDKTC